jgi:hypothetical protein
MLVTIVKRFQVPRRILLAVGFQSSVLQKEDQSEASSRYDSTSYRVQLVYRYCSVENGNEISVRSVVHFSFPNISTSTDI